MLMAGPWSMRWEALVIEAFHKPKAAALALLSECPAISHKEAGFLGHVCVAERLTGRQGDWLRKILDRNGFPPIASDEEAI